MSFNIYPLENFIINQFIITFVMFIIYSIHCLALETTK